MLFVPQDKLVTLMVANHVLWPVTRFLNDKFVPAQHRQVGNHIITVSPMLCFDPARCMLVLQALV